MIRGGFKFVFHFFRVIKSRLADIETGPQPFITSYILGCQIPHLFDNTRK